MTKEQKAFLLETLIEESEISKDFRLKRLDIFKDSCDNGSKLLEEKLSDGWEVDTVLKTKTKIFKNKPTDVSFEDKVWCLFAQLGFKQMSRGRNICIPCDKKDDTLYYEANLLAKDDETIILIDVETAEKNKLSNFSEKLNSFKAKKQSIINSLNALFPGSKPKFKYILATKNIVLSDEDVALLSTFDGIHFSEEIIDYYYSLSSQIGIASRYQLLGFLFAGQDIPDLDNRIPAIEGKMGGHTYYSFSIEPEKLLKIGYVLHRNKANENMMPTYQRLIKKTRLKEIKSFIDVEKGYFPNSIIINIVTDKKKLLTFERSGNQVDNSISRIGILHLPKKYRSAFIIDGQHRLYGYSDSQYKSTNTIPVVALVNLERSEQVKLFMQINENQKPVSKDLRNTLDADLLWDSESYVEQLKALKSRIAISLGEDKLSPLYNRISIGEDKKSISTQQIGIALSRSDFLGKVKSKEIERPGTFYKGNVQLAFSNLSLFLRLCFLHIKEQLEELWNLENNIIVMNKGFYGITMVLNDIVNSLLENNVVSDSSSAKQIYKESIPYLDTIVNFYKQLDETKTNELKTAYGTPGDAKYWRTLQIFLKKQHDGLHFEGLEEYLKKEEKENNEQAFKLIREIESVFLKDRIEQKLQEEFGKNWLKKGLPEKIYVDASAIAAAKNREIEDEEDEKDPWDQLHLIDYREIISKNWSNMFEKLYTRPGDEKLSKEKKTSWIVNLNRIRNENYHTYYVTSDELSFIEEIYDWLANKKI